MVKNINDFVKNSKNKLNNCVYDNNNRGEKKSIVAKLIQNSSITCMLWLPDGQIVFGLADGKVKI